MSSKPESRHDTARYPCPVCLGVQMAKLKPEPGLDLVLDHCERCGGIWFDEGEVVRLRGSSPRALATRVKMSDKAWAMQCHSCHAAMSRDSERCPACGWKNVLGCPVCDQPLEPVNRDGVTLDICRRCRGAWLDNVELAEIWNRSVAALARRRGRTVPERYVDNYFFLDAFFWPLAMPFPGAGPAAIPGALPEGAGAVAEGAAAGIGDVAGGIVDQAGEVAGGVFGWVADFFSGFDVF